MREIVIDTETTGLDPRGGDRIVEIAAVELVNHLPTGRVFHHYLNPERDMPEDAFAVHGLATGFLADKPRFAEIADLFISFIDDARLVIHNAEFDIAFLNAELGRLAQPTRLARDGAVDTLTLARQKFPGAQASLDALCRRFAIDNSARTKHGALLDAELLSEVYLELIGGRQAGFDLATARGVQQAAAAAVRRFRPARPHVPSVAELAAHAALVGRLREPLWLA
jgi:DNA polymerase-3 subunit epsilon